MINKNMLITGSSTRIGKEIAIHFSKRGWNIAIHYFKSYSKARELKKIVEKNSVKAVLIKGDLKNEKAVKNIFQNILEKFETLDTCVFATGIHDPTAEK